MDNFDYPAIGQRIKQLRKRKGLNQSELAQMLKKSLRTVQKYETGEIEVSIAVVNQIADLLDTTSTYILGYESSTTQIRTLADVMDFLFKLETVEGIDFKINVQKPPRSKQWECSVSFDGKSTAEFNADACSLSSGRTNAASFAPITPRRQHISAGRSRLWHITPRTQSNAQSRRSLTAMSESQSGRSFWKRNTVKTRVMSK